MLRLVPPATSFDNPIPGGSCGHREEGCAEEIRREKEDGIEEDGIEEDGIEEDGIEEDGIEEDRIEEDRIEEDRIKTVR